MVFVIFNVLENAGNWDLVFITDMINFSKEVLKIFNMMSTSFETLIMSVINILWNPFYNLGVRKKENVFTMKNFHRIRKYPKDFVACYMQPM